MAEELAGNSEKTVKKRGPGRPFKPGETANPSGRPAVARDFRERCRAYMEVEGWDNIIAMASNPKDRDKYRAAELIAAYAYGKPKQGLEVTGDEGGPVILAALTPEERAAKIAGYLARLQDNG